MNYIDNNLKTPNQNKTIGILIVKENNKFVIKYKTNNEIISRIYELIKYYAFYYFSKVYNQLNTY